MKSKVYSYFLNKPVTIITQITNQPITPESAVNLFSGILEEYDGEAFYVRLLDGTLAAFFKGPALVALIENETIRPDDPRLQSLATEPPCPHVCNGEGNREGNGGSEEASRPEDPELHLPQAEG